MATVSLWLPASTAAGVVHRQCVLKAGRLILPLPITSPKAMHSGLEPNWVQIPRLGVGIEPLMRKGGYKPPQLRLDVTFLHLDGRDVETDLTVLEQIANHDTPCTIGAWGGMADGLWWITSMPISSEQRQLGTNRIVKATVALTFTRAPMNSYKKATVTAPKATPAKTPAKTSTKAAAPRTYTVKKGDTLTAISVRFYGTPSRFGDIAKKNGIKNPNRITPGQRLVLP